MGVLYWEARLNLNNLEKEQVNEKVERPDFHAYYQSGHPSQ